MFLTKIDETFKTPPDINFDINKEEQKKNNELFKKLDEQRKTLEDRLLQKLEELKKVCITEGEITGILPVEIYKTLMPGETEPKVKRRIGTTFKISQNVLQQFNSNNTNNDIGKLEANIELNKKIVAAAERLAKDKSANKSVRKKRRKDWQAASQRLLKLEKGLYKLKISNNKFNNSTTDYDNYASLNCHKNEFTLHNLNLWSHFSKSASKNKTKSCPTTPQGSIPNLLATNIDLTQKNILKIQNSIDDPSTSKKQLLSAKHNHKFVKCHSTKSLLNSYSKDLEKITNKNYIPAIPSKKLIKMSQSCSRFQNIDDKKNEKQYFSETPLYANVGYTSSVPYKSAYRQLNFPTLQDTKHLNVLNKSLNCSTLNNSWIKPKCLPIQTSDLENFDNEHLLSCYPNLNFKNVSKISNTEKLGQILKQISESAFQPSAYFLRNSLKQNQSLHCLQQQRCSSSSQSSAGSISIGSIASAASSGYHSSTLYVDPFCLTSTLTEDETMLQKLKNLTSKHLINTNFSTTSLDRKALKNGSTSILFNKDNNNTLESCYRNYDTVNTTTFPVNNSCWPIEINDFSKHRSSSAVRVIDYTDNISATSTLKKSSKSTSGLPLTNYGNVNNVSKNFDLLDQNSNKNISTLKTNLCVEDWIALINLKSSKKNYFKTSNLENLVKNDGTVTIV